MSRYGTPANEIGVYLVAIAYVRAAMELDGLRLETRHHDAPIRFLYCHAIELLLKTYLKLHGKTEEDLRRLGHELSAVATTASRLGMSLSDTDFALFDLIDRQNLLLGARYLSTGYYSMPTPVHLHETARYLSEHVRADLERANKYVNEWEVPHHPEYAAKLLAEASEE